MRFSEFLIERKKETQSYAYHTTRQRYLQSILKHGLVPNYNSGGYGSDETSRETGLPLTALPGVYFSKSSRNAISISHGMHNAGLIVIAKITQKSSEADEDRMGEIFNIATGRFSAIDKKILSNQSSLESMAHSRTLNIIDKIKNLYNIDARGLSILEPLIYEYNFLILEFTRDYKQKKYDNEYINKIKNLQNTLTKKLKFIANRKNNDESAETFKIDNTISFSGRNRIVGLYLLNDRIGWGDLGELNGDEYHKVDMPSKLLKYIK